MEADVTCHTVRQTTMVNSTPNSNIGLPFSSTASSTFRPSHLQEPSFFFSLFPGIKSSSVLSYFPSTLQVFPPPTPLLPSCLSQSALFSSSPSPLPRPPSPPLIYPVMFTTTEHLPVVRLLLPPAMSPSSPLASVALPDGANYITTAPLLYLPRLPRLLPHRQQQRRLL
jgi:hypothetical protein